MRRKEKAAPTAAEHEKTECRVFITQVRYEHSTWSGLRDLNPRSLGPKPSAIPNFAKPGWIRFWRRGFGRCGESTGYYIRFAWKMQPPFFGRRGCFTDGAVVFSDGMVVFFSAGKRSPPSPSPRGEGVAAGDGRGVVSDRSFFRRMQKRNE